MERCGNSEYVMEATVASLGGKWKSGGSKADRGEWGSKDGDGDGGDGSREDEDSSFCLQPAAAASFSLLIPRQHNLGKQ